MTDEQILDFENTMKALEGIIKELEKGDLNLDDSIKKFEEGLELSKKINNYLESSEKKITSLTSKEDGTIEEENFNA
jgi:exodeoxyribonuclease VII small subunit